MRQHLSALGADIVWVMVHLMQLHLVADLHADGTKRLPAE